MGIDKIGPGWRSAGAPVTGPLQPAEAVAGEPAARVPEDVHAHLAGGQASSLQANDALPAAFGNLPVTELPEDLPARPPSEGTIWAGDQVMGGAGALRAFAGRHDSGPVTISGAALAPLRVRISDGDRSQVVRPAEIGLVAISVAPR